MKAPRPPRWADGLLKLLCSPHLLEEIQGDLYERYDNDLTAFGRQEADRRYIWNVIGFIRLRFGFERAGWSKALKNHTKPNTRNLFSAMFTSYFKIALRNIWRNRTTSTVGILGLSAGLASGLVIFLLVGYLFSFNRYHSKADRIYWIVTDVLTDQPRPTDVTPRPLGQVLRDEYPFVESAVRLNNLFGTIVGIPDGKGRMAKKFEESRNICFTEPEYFKVFDTRWASNAPQNALSEPNTVVLSREYAVKYFGTENAVGKTLRFDNKADLTVTGIIENPPSNTQLRYDVLVSYTTLPGLMGEPDMLQAWGAPNTMCWVALKDGAHLSQLENSFAEITRKHFSAKEARTYQFRTIALNEMFHMPGYGPAPRPILYALIVVGLFLVIGACVNFINLSTAQAIRRVREVGVRKTMGSSKTQLTGQFMLETALLCAAAFVIALILAQLSFPMLNRALWMLRADISVLHLLKGNGILWFGGLVLGVILLAGFYPSVVLARFNPVTALKGAAGNQKAGRFSVRKSLVVVQFFITQLFIIGVIVMSAQVKHLKTAETGFDKDHILMVKMPGDDLARQSTWVNELSAMPGVKRVALAAEPPMSQMKTDELFTFNHRDEQEKFPVNVRIGDSRYVEVFGLKLLAGRNLGSDDTTRREALVNQTMLKQLGIANPKDILNKSIRLWDRDRTIVGVVGNFSLDPLSAGVQPAAIVNEAPAYTMAAVKLQRADLHPVLPRIEKAWNKLFPENVYQAGFLDDKINEYYATEHILLGLIQVFSAIAIAIGCLGLYGLVTFMAASRSKEIGVRKVLGATEKQVVWIFGKEFGRLLATGFLLAAPLGWFLMKNWLQRYPRQIELGWWVFAVTAGSVVLITALTISFQSLRAARRNPVVSLRSE
ncbi:ABC transporter permease [Dyadobacter sp. OTU695]|uniref:ABC transporter permease n=1 Tax=Dyadobacter sp. OTU695 TaxID=3043860 RepID=UPI00313D9DB3